MGVEGWCGVVRAVISRFGVVGEPSVEAQPLHGREAFKEVAKGFIILDKPASEVEVA